MLAIQRLLAEEPPGPSEIAAFLEEHSFPVVEGREATFVYRGRADQVNLRHFIFGLPSALHMAVFKNQDWVWGLGLLISGALFSLGTIAGARRRRREPGRRRGATTLQRVAHGLIVCFIPAAFMIILGWWLYQSVTWDPAGWWHPWASASLGTCVLQWTVVLVCLFLLNRWLGRRLSGAAGEGGA